MKYTTITKCRLCESLEIQQVLDFGVTALANAYPKHQDDPEDTYPLSVAKCAACGHVQLEQTVAPEILFKDYLYSSSDSPALVAHFKEFAHTVAMTLRLHPDARLLEIGCNDGGLLREFKALGFSNLYGVDPASNLTGKACASGTLVFNDFLTLDLAKRIRERLGPMDLIFATNAFAHIADTPGMVDAIEHLLSENGVFVFENAYLLDTVQNLYFDQIYHEHLQYYGVRPLLGFFSRFGLEVFDVQHTTAQGGSIRVFVKRNTNLGKPITERFHSLLVGEEAAGLYDDAMFDRFSCDLQQFVIHFDKLMADLRHLGGTFSCYGCPAKFTLMSKMLGLHKGNVAYVVDDSPVKQGRFTPGAKIPIVDNTHFRLHPTDYCIVTAWNMADAIIHRNPHFRGEWINPYSGVIKKREREACNCPETSVKTG